MSQLVKINFNTINRDHARLNKYLSQKTLRVNVPKLNLFMVGKFRAVGVLFADFCEANRRQLKCYFGALSNPNTLSDWSNWFD
jgi:hypothetical protein